MKKIFMTMILIWIVLTPCRFYSQVGVGMRDNRFVFGDYEFSDKVTIKLEHSVFAEKFSYQYVRACLNYMGAVEKLYYKAGAYFGTTYNNSFYSAGLNVGLRYAFDRILIDAKINPHYDSGLGSKLCYAGGIGFVIGQNVNLLAGYTTVPVYREPEKRITVGFDFHVANLSVSPQVSTVVTGASKGKTLRVLMGFRYQF